MARAKLPVLMVAVAVGAVVVVALALRPRNPLGTISEPGRYADDWIEVADSPLSPRVRATAVWTGEEVLVLGGDPDDPCPDLCIVEALPDMAAYDPTTDRWRALAPVPVRWYIGGVVRFAGDHLVTSGQLPDGNGALVAYDVRADAWGEIEMDPRVGRADEIVAVGDRLLFAATCVCPAHDGRSWLLDVGAREWTEVPDDPYPNPALRQVAMVDGDLFVFTSQAPPGEASAAVLRAGERRWRALPSLPETRLQQYPDRPPLVIGDLVVLDGGEGPVFNTGFSRWETAPEDLRSSLPDVASRPEAPWTAATAWLGDRWFAFGGRVSEGLTNRAYLWSPGD